MECYEMCQYICYGYVIYEMESCLLPKEVLRYDDVGVSVIIDGILPAPVLSAP